MQVVTDRPRFRQDLLAEAVDDHGGRFVDVMDPDSGSYFRFYEVEFSLACAMDGERDVPGLVRWAEEELGVTPTAQEVRSVIATLGELGYLDQTAAAKAASADAAAATAAGAAAAAAAAEPVRTPIPVEDRTQRPTPTATAAAAPPVGGTSEVSIDLSEHLPVGPADVQEAVRQSRVMAAIEPPPELMEPPAPTPPVAAKPVSTPPVSERPPVSTPPASERPAARPQTPTPPSRPSDRIGVPAEAKQAERPKTPAPVSTPPVSERPAERPTERPKTPAPVEAKQPERPVAEAKQPEVHKPAVELPKVPEKQPVPPPAPERRVSPVLIVLLILVLLGGGAFAVWKLVLDKSSKPAPTPPSGSAAVAPEQPPAEAPPARPVRTFNAKIEMASGRPKTILAFFPGTIEWMEASGKEVKSGDVVVKMQGYRPLEAQVAALKKELDKAQADLAAAAKARDAISVDDAGPRKKAEAKYAAVEKVQYAKSEQYQKKVDQLEPYYVRLTLDGTITMTRKVGEKVPENGPVATIVPTPVPSATFRVSPDVKVEPGTTVALRAGEQVLTCEVTDSQPEELRIACPEDPKAVEGLAVSYQAN